MATVKELMQLEGRVSVVTGGATGIGFRMALGLAEAGSNVVIASRKLEACEQAAGEIERAGVQALAVSCDVTKPADVDAMKEAVMKRFGRVDILVNNAALRRENAFAEMDYREWREVLDVTLDGAFHCVKACLPALRKSATGTIVNIGGLSAHTGAANRAHVVTAKAGIIGFTRALAHDLASDGITVNCVVPGLIGTPRPKDKPEPAHHLTHQTITGKRGRPEDVAATVRFLCGPAARYINGQAIHANGGAYLGG